MTLLIAHFVLLAWISYATATRLARDICDRFLAAAMLFWANIVIVCLLLSQIGKLGETSWFFRSSLLLGALSLWLVRRGVAPDALPDLPPAPAEEKRSGWLITGVLGSLFFILLAHLRIAWVYEPNNYDSLTYHLPRVMYYLGHNNLAQYQTADIRQVYFPFNYNLLQLACFTYSPPWQAINFLNVAAWVVTGLGVFRVSRLSGNSFNASLGSMWLALTATGVIAQATATTLDLPTVGALLAGFAFALRWRQGRRTPDAWMAGLAAGLTAGAKLTVVFFGPAAVLLLLVSWLQHWRRQETRAFITGIRAWILPGVIAAILILPFIIYNLLATGEWMTKKLDFTLNKPFHLAVALQTAKGYLFQLFFEPFGRFSFDLDLISSLNDWFARVFFKNWNNGYTFSNFYVIPPDLNEDHVWYGFVGPLFLVCAVICLWRDRRLRGPVAWFALLGIGWFATYFAMNKWSLYIQRYFLTAIVLMAPCAAAVWDGGRGGSRLLGNAKRAIFYTVAFTAAWFSIVYLALNHNRPFTLPYSSFVAPRVLPHMPPLLKQRLAEHPDINVVTEGTNERIFLLMRSGHGQRFTSTPQVDPKRYNVLSYWSFTRNNIFSNIAHIASHTVVHVPDKRTAGVEFLGTVGEGVNAFDYVGLMAHANETTSQPENQNIVVLVHYGPGDPERFAHCLLRVDGLNARDQARVVVKAEMTDGSVVPLMSQTHSSEIKFSLHAPFKRLSIQVLDLATGRRIGFGDLPYTTKPTDGDIPAPLSANTLFRTELIAPGTVRNLLVNGLADLEGPYGQWNLPTFRWAKQPTVRIEIPDNPKLRRLKLSFKVRLQVRDKAHLSVLHNGNLIGDFWLEGMAEWHDEVIEFQPTPGDNVIELCDRPNDKVPDWLAYLAQNPDVKAAILVAGQPLEAGAREHYFSHGKSEHRALPLKTRTTDEVPDWLAYLAQNPDVKAYVASTSVAPEEGARWHYENHGQAEHRPLPMHSNPTPNAAPPDSLYFLYASLQMEGFTQ